jgi:GT2 family glycosyltransferase
MAEAPRVAIVIVNYNSAEFVDEFCSTLATVADPPWQLVAVDSASADASMDAIERAFPSANAVRCDENVGFAAGANIGIERALQLGVEYILFLNVDVTLTPDFLRQLAGAADERTFVVPKILYYFDHRLVSTHAGRFDWRLGLFRETYGGKPDGPATNVRRDGLDTASFCCALVPAQAFRDAGLLDERFFMYYEETDFIRRAQAAGYRVRYEPSSVIYHRESGASGGGWMTPFKQYYATRNRPYLVRKHASSGFAYAYFTAYFWTARIATALAMVARGEWRLLRAMALGGRDYYRGRMGRTMQVKDL